MSPPLNELLDCAVAAARAAGLYALANKDRRSEVEVSTRHDLKLRLDGECQAIATSVILEHYPGHAVLGEEDEVHDQAGPGTSVEWVIDPIDGTVNYYHGLPLWCCSIAARVNGDSIAGVVYEPEADHLYSATRDDAAKMNGAPIEVSVVDRMEHAVFLTGLNQKVEGDASKHQAVQAVSNQAQKTRVLGSAALDMCRVAAGHAEIYWEAGIYTWDMAAASLIVRQAGGKTCTLKKLDEPHRLSFLATNAHLHERAREAIRNATEG